MGTNITGIFNNKILTRKRQKYKIKSFINLIQPSRVDTIGSIGYYDVYSFRKGTGIFELGAV